MGKTPFGNISPSPISVWLDEYWAEIDNVRAALEWATQPENDEDAVLAGQIAGNFRGLWLVPGLFRECRRWIELILGRIDEVQQPSLAATLLTALTHVLTGSELIDATRRLLTALRLLGDRHRLVASLPNAALRYCYGGFFSSAQRAIDETLDILAQDGLLRAPSRETLKIMIRVCYARAELSLARRLLDDARAHVTEAVANAERIGDDFSLISMLILRAEIEFTDGNVALAGEYSNAAVERANAIPRGTALLAAALCRDACIRLSTPEIDGAETAARQAFSVANDLGDEQLRHLSTQNLAAVAARRGNPRTAARLLGSIEAWRHSVGYRPQVFEEAARALLLTALHERLGAETETHISRGRLTTLDSATNEALAIIEH